MDNPVYDLIMPLFELAPYATFCILLLIIISTVHLRRTILRYMQEKRPQCFADFTLYEEQQHDTSSLALFHYLGSNAFEKTNDPFFIDLCKRYIRWARFFTLFFVAATVDISPSLLVAG